MKKFSASSKADVEKKMSLWIRNAGERLKPKPKTGEKTKT